MQIFNEDTFEYVIRFIDLGYNPVALDFASGTNPGGGWRSKQQGTQEESLCRRSNLGILLEKKKYPIPRDSAFYIKDVIINKDFNMNYIISKKCSILASELKGISSSTDKYIQQRLDNLYSLAINNGHDIIILDAWGCGAFSESNEDIKILKKKLISYQINIII